MGNTMRASKGYRGFRKSNIQRWLTIHSKLGYIHVRNIHFSWLLATSEAGVAE